MTAASAGSGAVRAGAEGVPGGPGRRARVGPPSEDRGGGRGGWGRGEYGRL